MTGTFRAFLDASVLYSAPLRDLLMRLTLAGLYQARWSHDVHEEWIRALLRDRSDLTAAQLRGVRTAMDEHGEDCLVTGYESLIGSLALPDPDDRHVLAAAIVAGASVIVTYNLRDFPFESLARYEIEAQHPDEFVRHVIDLAPVLVVDVVRAQQASLKNPPLTIDTLLALFEQIGLAETVAELRRLIDDPK
jgi:predicted nucleic acid-binding protein